MLSNSKSFCTILSGEESSQFMREIWGSTLGITFRFNDAKPPKRYRVFRILKAHQLEHFPLQTTQLMIKKTHSCKTLHQRVPANLEIGIVSSGKGLN